MAKKPTPTGIRGAIKNRNADEPTVPKSLQRGGSAPASSKQQTDAKAPKLEVGPTTGPVLEPGMPRQKSVLVMAPANPASVARPATVAKVPGEVRLHWTQVAPDLMAERIDPHTGAPLPGRAREGGQYSGRLLTLVNKATKKARKVAVLTSIEPSTWPLKPYERVSDPQQYPEDEVHGPGNVEVIFDFQDERETWFAAMGASTKFDPLALNDIPPGQAPPDKILASRIVQE